MSDAVATVRGVITLLAVTLNTIATGVPLCLVAIARAAIPVAAWRRLAASIITWFADSWVAINNFNVDHMLRSRVEIAGLDGIDPKRSYLVGANHQSWTDIVVLQYVFRGHAPFLRFFLKQELIWVPILGVAWWGLDFPFMKRYSREYLEKHPERRGADREATRRSCERLRDADLSIMNFLEGTRFTVEKHRRQDSPYTHLLRPKAGGAAFALDALGDKLETLLDTTIVYPDGAPTMWEFLCGRVSRIIVHVETLPIPPEMRNGDYTEDQEFRGRFQGWVGDLWDSKDRHIGEILASERGRDA